MTYPPFMRKTEFMKKNYRTKIHILEHAYRRERGRVKDRQRKRMRGGEERGREGDKCREGEMGW